MAEERTLATIAADLERETGAYEGGRERLEIAREGLVPDPAETVSDLLSWSEEFGREHAIELLQNDLHGYPSDPRIAESWPERAPKISAAVDALLDTQDRLDALTLEKERAVPPSLGNRLVNVQGQELELLSAKGVLKDRQGQEHPVGREPELTLTQKMAREVGAEPYQPDLSAKDRTRSR